MAFDLSSLNIKMSGQESEPLSPGTPKLKSNKMKDVSLTPTFGLSPRSKQQRRMEEGEGIDIEWVDDFRDDSEVKPIYSLSYTAATLGWMRRNKKKVIVGGILAFVGVVAISSSNKIHANMQANKHKKAALVGSKSPKSKSPKSKSPKMGGLALGLGYGPMPTTSPSTAPSKSPSGSPTHVPTYIRSEATSMNATVEFDSDDGFETTETEEEEVEEEVLEEIVETIDEEQVEETAETEEEEETMGGDKEIIFEAMEEEQEADVDPKEPTYLPTMSPTIGLKDPTYLPTMSPTDECFRDGTECQDCSNECCSGDLGDGSGWFKCPNGMEFCGDQNVLGAVLC